MPLRYGANVVGVLVISRLGMDQFDADDLRLLEVLAGHASVALVNAQLYEVKRREAEGAKALLELSRELSTETQIDEVVEGIARGAARILDVARASIWIPDEDAGSSAAPPGRGTQISARNPATGCPPRPLHASR